MLTQWTDKEQCNMSELSSINRMYMFVTVCVAWFTLVQSVRNSSAHL